MKTLNVAIQSRADLPRTYEALESFSWELFLSYKQLEEKYRKLSKQQYGRSSEKLSTTDGEQMRLEELLAGVEPAPEEAVSETVVTVPAHSRRTKHPGRNAIPDDVEKQEVIHDIDPGQKICEHCNKPKAVLFTKEHTTVERIPATYEVVVHRYPVYGCPQCKDTPVKAEPQVLPIAKGIAGVGLLCFVILSKYLYHLPLYRIQRQIYHESRIWFSRQTMAGWVRQIAGLLRRLYDELLIEYQQSRIKHADDTSLPVQRNEGSGTVHQGFLWAGLGVGEEPVGIFRYHPHRSGEGAKQLLKDSSRGSYLMIDDCASFNKPVKEYDLRAQLCMAHARRQFIEAVECGYQASFGRRVIRIIGHLYRLERFADAKDFTLEQRTELRRTVSMRILGQLKYRLENPGFVKIPNSAMAKAIEYLLSKWDRVIRYCESGDLPIDNNALERLIRTVVIGRNNWIKAGAESGAQWMGIIYSIIATCTLNKVNVHEYLPDVLMRLAIRAADQRVKDLLPAAWKKSKASQGETTDMKYSKN